MRRPKLLPTLLIASVLSTGAIVHSKEPQRRDSSRADTDSLFLSLIQVVGASPTPAETQEPELNLKVLDVLSSVYEEADYYTTGLCDERLRPKNPNTKVYVDGLPDKIIHEFQRPVEGRITSHFGLREGGNRMHKGVDIALQKGDSIRAAISGTVTRVGYERGGYGYFIIVDHPGGIQSRYAHLQQPLIKPGTPITPGTIIAIGGSSGNSTGPHLHFEIRCGGTPMDPTPLLTRQCEK